MHPEGPGAAPLRARWRFVMKSSAERACPGPGSGQVCGGDGMNWPRGAIAQGLQGGEGAVGQWVGSKGVACCREFALVS